MGFAVFAAQRISKGGPKYRFWRGLDKFSWYLGSPVYIKFQILILKDKADICLLQHISVSFQISFGLAVFTAHWNC